MTGPERRDIRRDTERTPSNRESEHLSGHGLYRSAAADFGAERPCG